MTVTALKIVITILAVFAAIGLACAVRIALRPQPRQRDPFFHPFGDMPGLSDQQLREITRKSAARIARDPLRRSFAVRYPHDRPLYGSNCIRCGASTSAEFAASCIPDPFLNSGQRSPPRVRPDAGGVGGSSPRVHAVRRFFAVLLGSRSHAA